MAGQSAAASLQPSPRLFDFLLLLFLFSILPLFLPPGEGDISGARRREVAGGAGHCTRCRISAAMAVSDLGRSAHDSPELEAACDEAADRLEGRRDAVRAPRPRTASHRTSLARRGAVLLSVLAACATGWHVFRASSRHSVGDRGSVLLESAEGGGAYSRALRQIRAGRDVASDGHFRQAATYFLRAKDLWQVSGVPGWESAQTLVDAATDENPAALRDSLWAVSDLVADGGAPRDAAAPPAWLQKGDGGRSAWRRRYEGRMQETEGSPAMPGSLEAVDETRWVHSIEDRRQ